MSRLKLPIVLAHAGNLPSYAHEGDAGMDLRASETIALEPFERALIPTGVKAAIPDGYAGFVLPRSGLAIKHGFSLVNTPGLIDSGYRGEIKVIGINLDPTEPFTIEAGDRIAQLVVMRVETCDPTACDGLPESERGVGGFGSSGA